MLKIRFCRNIYLGNIYVTPILGNLRKLGVGKEVKKMTQMDRQWNELVKDIIENGYDQDEKDTGTYYKDGDKAPTKYLIGKTFEFDGSEAAIMEGKKINITKPIGEILWILQDQSNNLGTLRDKYKISFWDDWEYGGTDTIGKSYGWMVKNKTRKVHIDDVVPEAVSKERYAEIERWRNLKKTWLGKVSSRIQKVLGFDDDYIELSQIESLLQGLKTNPYSRRYVISLWDSNAQEESGLPPCVWSSMWYVTPDNKLHVEVTARSSDMALGNPFNLIQYQSMQASIAKCVGLTMGKFRFHMGNPHIYKRHIEGALEIIKREKDLSDNKPQIRIDDRIDNFFDITPEDITIENYEPEPFVKFEIAVHSKV